MARSLLGTEEFRYEIRQKRTLVALIKNPPQNKVIAWLNAVSLQSSAMLELQQRGNIGYVFCVGEDVNSDHVISHMVQNREMIDGAAVAFTKAQRDDLPLSPWTRIGVC